MCVKHIYVFLHPWRCEDIFILSHTLSDNLAKYRKLGSKLPPECLMSVATHGKSEPLWISLFLQQIFYFYCLWNLSSFSYSLLFCTFKQVFLRAGHFSFIPHPMCLFRTGDVFFTVLLLIFLPSWSLLFCFILVEDRLTESTFCISYLYFHFFCPGLSSYYLPSSPGLLPELEQASFFFFF